MDKFSKILLLALLSGISLPHASGADKVVNEAAWTDLQEEVLGAFPEAEMADDGWFRSDWLGWFNGTYHPWLYHLPIGWLYYGGGHETSHVFLYNFEHSEWLLTNPVLFPWVYTYRGPGDWITYPREAPAGMVHVEGGSFFIGERLTSVNEFFIGIHETTRAEWREVRTWAMNQGYDLAGIGLGCADNHPVHSVNWFDAVKWCNARSEKEGLTPVYYLDTAFTEVYRQGVENLSPAHVRWQADGYRLPTEAEHWFAHTGGNQSMGFDYAGSNDLEEVAWFEGNSAGAQCNYQDGQGTWPAGLKAPNELGLFDMSGNVWEWTFDWFDPASSAEAVINPHGPDTGTWRINRGGSWLSEAQRLLSFGTGWEFPDRRSPIH